MWSFGKHVNCMLHGMVFGDGGSLTATTALNLTVLEYPH
jgi:hypothetical protein